MSVIKSITLKSPLTTITLPVADAEPDDHYILRGVDGLGPPEINISMGQALYQGGVYQGSQPNDREVVIQLSLNPTFGGEFVSPARLRSELYSMLAGQFSTRLTIYTNSTDDETKYLPSEMYVDGYVKRIEIAPFAKDSIVQITMSCPLAWFLGANDSSQDLPLPSSFIYNASAPTGFIYHFQILQQAAALHIQAESNSVTYEVMALTYPFLPNDIIEFDSRPGNRSVKLIRAANNPIDITGFSIIDNNIWPSLRPGSNRIFVYETMWDAPMAKTERTFIYRKQYWGV
jgi:hypothetical protein